MRLILQLVLPADARLVPTTRKAVGSYLRDLDVGSECAHDVLLALDEACGNVVRHAFPGCEGTFTVMAELRDDEITMVVEDDGVGFEPRRVLHDPAGEDAPSGRGLGIIGCLMNGVDVQSPVSDGHGTRLTMRKQL